MQSSEALLRGRGMGWRVARKGKIPITQPRGEVRSAAPSLRRFLCKWRREKKGTAIYKPALSWGLHIIGRGRQVKDGEGEHLGDLITVVAPRGRKGVSKSSSQKVAHRVLNRI